ncbi:unnamed protein product [Porites evermanni]|uniref:T cell activation inhibitor, mitochondrial n=1 Tax=Porites evermanni TaxID=104178 RepID=A0ABN8MDE4_9CNID|nr:unnamed protein product [Porites evermanni]
MLSGIRRLSLKQSSWCILSRHLSSAQTKAALKPFYFAVHPDLFGQYPIQRSINEDSLKKLNSYLEDLQKKKPVNPTHLMFYLKNDTATALEEGSEIFKTVRVSLFSRDVYFTISHILKTCGMMEDLVTLHQNNRDSKLSVALPYDAPNHWLHVYQQFSDRQSPVDLAQLQRNSRSTLKDFLVQNIKNAKEKQESSKPLLKENALLSEAICKELGLKQLESANGWSYSSHHGCLKNFLRLCYTKQSELQRLNGRTVVFTDWTGIDPHGRVMLNIRDTPQFWLSLLSSLEDYDVLVSQVPTWQRRLSSLLGDMKIVFDQESPSVSVTEYLSYLYRIVSSMRRELLGSVDMSTCFQPREFKDFAIRILSPADSLSLSLGGEFRIPPSIPSELIVDFLVKNKQKSLELQEENERNLVIQDKAIKECQEKLQLECLLKDPSVSPLQMSDCCERLSRQDNPDLSGANLTVSRYYHVNEDGHISIPWNWK